VLICEFEFKEKHLSRFDSKRSYNLTSWWNRNR